MKEIKIESKTHGTHFVMVDDEDFDMVNKFIWHVTKGARTFYAQTNIDKHHTIKMHILIMGRSKSRLIDHKDGNGLNNSRVNLRECNHSLNSMNKKKRLDTKCKYKGVSWLPSRNRYIAQIWDGKRNIRLGYFLDQESAALSYNKAAIRYFGEFARPNVLCAG